MRESVRSNKSKSAMKRPDMVKRVSSRNTIQDWRSDDVISEGGSSALAKQLRHHGKLPSRFTGLTAEQRKHIDYINSFAEDIKWAFHELNSSVQVPIECVERIAIFLEESLSQESRNFHGVSHSYVISAGASPIQVLAAFFRDIVKHSVDHKWTPKQHEALKGYVKRRTNTIVEKLDDEYDQIVAKVFGYKLGQDLRKPYWLKQGESHISMDIFLSAVVASRYVGKIIGLKETAKLCACMEATIPFRPVNEGHPTPLDDLSRRLEACNAEFKLGMTEEEIKETVQQGCDLWNRNVGNMVTDDPAIFLDHTWSLLPEQDAALRLKSLYTLNQYHKAIATMKSNLMKMDANKIYLDFHGIPSEQECVFFRARLTDNLETVLSYIDARLLCAAVVTAIACLTGGADAPKSYFYGDVSSVQQSESVRFGDMLTILSHDKIAPSCVDEVYEILAANRMEHSDFDTKSARPAAYLYGHLGEEKTRKLVGMTVVPMTPGSSRALLCSIPEKLLQPLVKAIARMTPSRTSLIESLLDELQDPNLHTRVQI